MIKNNSVQLELEIKTYDIDMAGHVNNIVYVRWLEDLRTKLISEICDYKKLFESGHYLVVISTGIKYKKQLKFGELPIGKMELLNHSHGIINLKAAIEINDDISALAEQKCVVMNLTTNKMMPDKMISELFGRGKTE